MSQVTMYQYMDPTKPGVVASPPHLNTVYPRLAPAGGIHAGQFVCNGTGDVCALGEDANAINLKGLGFAIRDGSFAANSGAVPMYAENDDVPVLNRGLVWAKAVEAMAVDDPVFVIVASTNRGFIRNDADTANAVQLAGARVRDYKLVGAVHCVLVDMTATGTAGLTGATGATGATGPTGPTGPTGA